VASSAIAIAAAGWAQPPPQPPGQPPANPALGTGFAAHGLWGLGVQLGYSEHGSGRNLDSQVIARSLGFARDLAQASGCLPTAEIEELRQRALATANSRDLYRQILALRLRYALIVQQSCTCGGLGGAAAHGVWGVGVQTGYSEFGSGWDVSPRILARSFQYNVDLARVSGCVPVEEIEAMRVRMAAAPSSRPLAQDVLDLRLRYAQIVQNRCQCTAAAAPQVAPVACNPACRENQVCVNGTCVGTGSLRFTLTWDRPGDVDLHVRTPGGVDIHYARRHGGEGELDRDDTQGRGPENIFWDDAPPPGTYVVCVTPFAVRGTTNFTVTVSRDGQETQSFTGTRSRSSGNRTCRAGSSDFVAEITVP
jgi:hypothetical protein